MTTAGKWSLDGRWTAIVGALLLAPVVVLWVALPNAPLCVVRRLLALPCPGCGLGHALTALLRGDPAQAALWYPPLALLASGYGVALIAGSQRALGRSTTKVGVVGGWVGIAAGCAVLVNWTLELAQHLAA